MVPGITDEKGNPIQIDRNAYLAGILDNFSFDNWYQADRVLKKHYETTFGIFNHRDPDVRQNRPHAGAAVLPGNICSKSFVAEFLINDYRESGFQDILKMSFTEYCQIPQYLLSEMKESVQKIREREAIMKKQKEDEIQAAIAAAKGNAR